MKPPNMVINTTEECLAHLSAGYDQAKLRNWLKLFCKVERNAVEDWLSGKRLPVGKNLIRLRVFLQVVGYHVEELDAVSRPVRQVAQLIAFSKLTGEEVRSRLGFSSIQEVYRLILRAQGTSAKRETILDSIVRGQHEAIDQEFKKWQSRFADFLLPSAPSEPTGVEALENSSRAPADRIVGIEIVEVIDYQMAALDQMLASFMRQLKANKGPDSDMLLDALRRKLGERPTLRLVDNLTKVNDH